MPRLSPFLQRACHFAIGLGSLGVGVVLFWLGGKAIVGASAIGMALAALGFLTFLFGLFFLLGLVDPIPTTSPQPIPPLADRPGDPIEETLGAAHPLRPTLRRYAIDWARLEADWPAATVDRLLRAARALAPFEEQFADTIGSVNPLSAMVMMSQGRCTVFPLCEEAVPATAIAAERDWDQIVDILRAPQADPIARDRALVVMYAFVYDRLVAARTHLDIATVLRTMHTWSTARRQDPVAIAAVVADRARALTEDLRASVPPSPLSVCAPASSEGLLNHSRSTPADGVVPAPIARLSV